MSLLSIVFILGSCNNNLPADLELRRQSLDDKLNVVYSEYESVNSSKEAKELVLLINDLIDEINTYVRDCSDRGYPRDNEKLLSTLTEILLEMNTIIEASEEQEQKIMSIISNKYFQFKKNDSFGTTVQVAYFESNGTGEFFWEWSVGGTYEAGSSAMRWHIIDNMIHIEYVYTSKYGERSNESITLISNTNRIDQLEDYNSNDVYYKISSYSKKNISNQQNNNMMDAMQRISDPTFCSLCNGTGIEKNTAKDIFGGSDGRTCPMCEGKGRRSY